MIGQPSQMDLLGCTKVCEAYYQPSIDLLLDNNTKVFYIVLCLFVMIALLSWKLYKAKKTIQKLQEEK